MHMPRIFPVLNGSGDDGDDVGLESHAKGAADRSAVRRGLLLRVVLVLYTSSNTAHTDARRRCLGPIEVHFE